MEGMRQMSKLIPNAYLIKQIHDRLEKRANNSLRAQDLTIMQVSVLMVLHHSEHQQLSMKELEHYFGIAQSTVAGIISRLEKKGFVEALSDPEDKRVKLVHITHTGENCCKEASEHMHETERMLLHGLSDEEQTILNRLLIRTAGNLK